MAQQNRTTLKNYFQTGDKPSQAQYADLIDSKVNLSESNTGDLILTGGINATHITASGNISSSGNLIANNITSSGDISASSFISSKIFTIGTNSTVSSGLGMFIRDDETDANIGNILVSRGTTILGDITASGNITANSGSFNYIESINKIHHTDDADTEVSFALDNVQIKANTRETFRGGGNFTRLGNDDTPTRISGSSVIFNSPINSTSNIITTLNVTATGNISSNSGTGSFAGGIVLTAPNGNTFRFTTNNSGHLSLTGSAV